MITRGTIMTLTAALFISGTHGAHAQNPPRNTTPTDLNQGVERDIHGAPHGSVTNPSPEGPASTGRIRSGVPGNTGAAVSTPTDLNQGAERDTHGAPHGSVTNPSPDHR